MSPDNLGHYHTEALEALKDMKAEVMFFDGDWLKSVSFTSVVPAWLAQDPKRRAVAIRKPPLPASDHEFW
eukprot:554436-Prymnesium_polylepis.1